MSFVCIHKTYFCVFVVYTVLYRMFSMCYWQMLSFLIDTDVFRYGYTQLIHMYKQLHTTKNINHAGSSYTIMFYAIEFHMFICVLLILCAMGFSYEYVNTHSYMIYMNICSCVHMLYLWQKRMIEHMNNCSYVIYVNVCTYVHMRYITLVVYN